MEEHKCYAGFTNSDLIAELFKMHEKQREKEEKEERECKIEVRNIDIGELIDELYEKKNTVRDFFKRVGGARSKEDDAAEDEPLEEEEEEEENDPSDFVIAIAALIEEIDKIGENDVSKFKGMASVMLDFGLRLSFTREMMNTCITEVYEANGIEDL